MARSNQRIPSLEQDLLRIKNAHDKGKEKRYGATEALRRQKIIVSIVALIILVILFLAYEGFHEIPEEHLITISSTQGPVTIWHSATRATGAAELHAILSNGDQVHTGSGGFVALSFPDGSMVKIEPGTVFRVVYAGFNRRSGGRHRVFALNSGRMWARVSRFVSGDSSFDINTPTALAGVRGTRFSVAVSGTGVTSVSVPEGTVSLQSNGSPVRALVQAGQQALALAAMPGAPQPAPITPGEQAAWQAEGSEPGGDVMAPPPGVFGEFFINLSQQMLVRPIATVASWVHLDGLSGANDEPGYDYTAYYDVAAYAKAMSAAHALRTALEGTNSYPNSIGLTDLSGLSFSQNQVHQILDDMEGHALLYYHATGSNYDIFFRAKRPSEALIELTPDGAKVVPDVTHG